MKVGEGGGGELRLFTCGHMLHSKCLEDVTYQQQQQQQLTDLENNGDEVEMDALAPRRIAMNVCRLSTAANMCPRCYERQVADAIATPLSNKCRGEGRELDASSDTSKAKETMNSKKASRRTMKSEADETNPFL